MRPGPARGETATLDVLVTSEMTTHVDGEVLHPVYGTAALVQHVEQVCRSILVPHLEDGEEAVGHRIDLTHRVRVPVGTALTLTATVAKVGHQELVCEVLVRHGNRLVARGSFDQRVVSADELRAEVEGLGAGV